MVSILGINSFNNKFLTKISEKKADIINNNANPIKDLKKPNLSNLQAYHPSFTAKDVENNNSTNKFPSFKKQLELVNSKVNKETKVLLKNLNDKGILTDNSSNDGSTVIENLYKIATEPRIPGLDDGLIIEEVVKALNNPCSITQKFGNIPEDIKEQMNITKTPEFSHSCVAASNEFALAQKKPAEFARFAQELSGENYSVKKKVKISDFSNGFLDGIYQLRKYNTSYKIDKNWEDVEINIHPDRNAIVRARVQTSYKDPKERSCVDVLIQSALINLGSQDTYDSITDKRELSEFNSSEYGLSDIEKNFVEQILFETPKVSVLYQDVDENGYLTGYNCSFDETKEHILKSLELNQSVIIGYTILNSDNQVAGGHEITIIGYGQDKDGKGYFICNDTDDDIDKPILISEEKLLPVIHHAGIPKEIFKEGEITEPWKEILELFKQSLETNY